MTNQLALCKFPIATTTDVEEAESVLSGKLSQLRIQQVRDPKHFGLRVNGFNLGSVGVIFNEFATDTHLDPDDLTNSVGLMIGSGRASEFTIDNEAVACHGNAAAIAGPKRKLRIQRPGGAGVTIVRVPWEAIERRYREDTGRELPAAFSFEKQVDLSKPPWAALRRSVEFLAATLHDNPGILKNPHFRLGFDELLLGQFLSLPHSDCDGLDASSVRAVPRIVRLAEEYLEAHTTDAIAVADVLRVCGCSRSLLYASFQKFRGYSPMEFLAEQRLQLVRARLRNAHPADSVTAAACDCGFTHLGRFSTAYKRRFGEPPSHTLKSNR